jgi:hypothetical protein
LLAGQKVQDQPVAAASLVPTWMWAAGAAGLAALILLIYLLAV